ncbi:MAG: hypothetical protein R6V54_07710 [Desulfobacteraceae bacterium]
MLTATAQNRYGQNPEPAAFNSTFYFCCEHAAHGRYTTIINFQKGCFMTTEDDKTITFHYIKAPDYKVHEVHGGVGGINAHGQVVLNLYFERGPIPRKATHRFDKNGKLEAEAIDTEVKDGPVRDVLFGLAMTPEKARSLAEWLNGQAAQMDSLLNSEGEQINE